MAKSIGNTQVTPISPAMPPFISLAGKLRDKEIERIGKHYIVLHEPQRSLIKYIS